MRHKRQDPELQVWGGVECTINRVGDRYFNQLRTSGHWDRFEDLDRLAELGITALRFPLLWEALAPDSLDQIDWSWSDARLDHLRALGLRPIGGLLHHGSGPRYTDLLDPKFPEKFAQFAQAVAERYPWLDAYTPINEPLTTARFSGLYGHWYPHCRDDRAFHRMLFNEIRGTVLAMRAIREVNPEAILIQTEDLGRTYGTPGIRYQADFDNERRWLPWDLLLGKVQPGHPMWSYLSWLGVAADELNFFAENLCSPDILGINYYVTSERYLDENIENYPAELHGYNGRQVYADDAAVRARPLGLAGARIIMAEAFHRYGLPIALTEVHLGCTVDEQMRWFMEAWQAAQTMRSRGADVRAVTAWALVGSFDWDSLVTHHAHHYEPGAFTIRDGAVHPTALASMLQQLAHGEIPKDPILDSPGWWRQRTRLRGPTNVRIAA